MPSFPDLVGDAFLFLLFQNICYSFVPDMNPESVY